MTSSRYTQWIKESGPYRVDSMALAFGEIRVKPKWIQYGDHWQEDQRAGQGGGPGVFSRLALASDIEALLNSAYSDEEVRAWRDDERSEWNHANFEDDDDDN